MRTYQPYVCVHVSAGDSHIHNVYTTLRSVRSMIRTLYKTGVIAAHMNQNEIRQTAFTSDSSPLLIPNFTTIHVFLR